MSVLAPAVMLAVADKAAELLPDVNVQLGFDGATDPGDYLWVGTGDPYSTALSPAVSARLKWAGAQRQTGRDEDADLFCCVESWNGDGNIRAAIGSVSTIFDTLDGWLKTSDHSDVPGLFTATVASYSFDLARTITGEGVARIIFSINYTGRS